MRPALALEEARLTPLLVLGPRPAVSIAGQISELRSCKKWMPARGTRSAANRFAASSAVGQPRENPARFSTFTSAVAASQHVGRRAKTKARVARPARRRVFRHAPPHAVPLSARRGARVAAVLGIRRARIIEERYEGCGQTRRKPVGRARAEPARSPVRVRAGTGRAAAPAKEGGCHGRAAPRPVHLPSSADRRSSVRATIAGAAFCRALVSRSSRRFLLRRLSRRRSRLYPSSCSVRVSTGRGPFRPGQRIIEEKETPSPRAPQIERCGARCCSLGDRDRGSWLAGSRVRATIPHSNSQPLTDRRATARHTTAGGSP
jgi:hypothetical protein